MKIFHLLFGFFLALTACQKPNQKKIVAIQPFEHFNAAAVDTVAKVISSFYNRKVVILNPIPLPTSSFIQIKSPRYRADSLLIFLQKIKPDSVDWIFGLTSSDISITKKDANGQVKKPVSTYTDWGIFGLAHCPGKAAIVSHFRLQNTNSTLYFSRLKKVSIHEFGHNLGLKHCPNKQCVMQDAAESIRTIDEVQLFLCDACRNKI